MARTDRDLVIRWWDEAWNEGLWAGGWNKTLSGVTAGQAAWKPSPDRRSIWQLVLHMIFWREAWLRRIVDGIKASAETIARENFVEVEDASDAAWDETRRRFAETQERMAALFRDSKVPINDFMYVLPHDCYHFGQIGYLRAMQGLPAVE